MSTLPELFVQLPPLVASHLEELLEVLSIPADPTRDEVLEVAQTIADELRYSTSSEDEKLLALIDQIPQAVVEQLFAINTS